MFWTKVVEKIKTTFYIQERAVFRKSFRLWDNVENFGRSGQATDDNM